MRAQKVDSFRYYCVADIDRPVHTHTHVTPPNVPVTPNFAREAYRVDRIASQNNNKNNKTCFTFFVQDDFVCVCARVCDMDGCICMIWKQ
mmetsp:Transcript_32395/g.49556  ORF Transcript_32395/g.49556 Transcript_32395/m.49556 type:complete len:90 (+) Transcript_32395:96-365(+)